MAAIRHTMSSSDETMPESVTLFELFNVKDPQELDIQAKWLHNKPYKTLAVPIGLRSADNILELNLHEKAHGPHGLLAGTTGSGKSETLQTYIASLAVHFHPHDIAFLLIDYKGGGMANLFDKLPHLLGTITNLDGAQSMRALIAIKSEMKRRQTVLSKNNVNHIDSYQKLCAGNAALEPMPHLFIISDEFAELKREQPDFISELVSAARIGRSLGIHLILATQKPSGVVNDQIWSNSNFRICLKVQDRSDSNEMLKTPDAADIKLPGRGYLQVGNNIIYELFQSAYSGAEYRDGAGKSDEKPDDNIYYWNELGQAQLLTKDFSTLHVGEEGAAAVPITELDVTIQAVEQAFMNTGLDKVPSPWLPPLSTAVYLPDLLGNTALSPEWDSPDLDWEQPFTDDLQITVGLVDEIERQRQTPLLLNFSKEGHAAAFGSAGSGKSTFLHTIALSLALRYTPAQVNFLILDFGNNSLLPLQALPHTADAFTLEDPEKLRKLFRLLNKEIKKRKDLLGASRVSSITLHNRISNKPPIPALFLFLDNMDPLKEYDKDLTKSKLEALVKDIARDGLALSIFLIFTASRFGAVRNTTVGSVEKRFLFHVHEKSEISTTLGGRSGLQSENIPGRGLTQLDTISSFQAALPTYGSSVEERIHEFQAAMDSLHALWPGPLPEPVPMMPDILPIHDFFDKDSVQDALQTPDLRLPIALDNDDVQAFCIDFSKVSHINIVGSHNAGKTNTIKVILESLLRKNLPFSVRLLDDSLLKLNSYKDIYPGCRYLTEAAEFSAVLQDVSQELENRKDSYAQKMKNNETTLTPAEYCATLTPHLIIINNVGNFASKLSAAEQGNLGQLIISSSLTGIHFCFVSNIQDYPPSYDKMFNAYKSINTLFSFLPYEQNPLIPADMRYSKTRSLRAGEAHYIHSGVMTLVKIPFIDTDINRT